MILVDTSAWIELLRDRATPARRELEDLIRHSPDELAITDPIVMELLAGARSELHAARLRRLLATYHYIALDGLSDHERAAAMARACRRAGVAPPSSGACLVAAVALRADAEVFAADDRFVELGRHTSLRLCRGAGVTAS